MQLPAPLLATLEIGLNRYLAEDEQTLVALAKLQDRMISLRLREFDLCLYLRPHSAGIQVLGDSVDEPAVEIESSIPTLARAMLQPDQHQQLTTSGEIRIDGDVELAQQFFTILREADFDPEEWLSRHIGDVAAYRAGQFLRGAMDFGRRSFEGLFANGGRMMQKESGDLVNADESRQWMDGVDSLRSSVDRIEARIARLIAKREGAQ